MRTNDKVTAPDSVTEAQTALRRLERRDWSRLMIFLTIVGLLTVMAWFLTSEYHGPVSASDIHIAVTGLVAVVLLFSLFSVYQQRITINLRRQLSANVAMAATLEALKPVPGASSETRRQRRQYQRFYFDEVLRVHGGANRSMAPVFGRTSNLGEGGIAAVLPQPLDVGTTVVVEFAADNGAKFSCSAMVRHRRGYLHGFEFTQVSAEQRQVLRQIGRRCAPVDFEPVDGSPATPESARVRPSTEAGPAH